MKTTLDISDHILLRAKELSKAEHVPLRRLTEEGLQLVLDLRGRRRPYKAKPVVFKGQGLNPAYRESTWATVRDEAYRGRGA